MDADDEAAMLAELDKELGIKPMDPVERCRELKMQVATELKATMDCKTAGNREQAIVHLKEKKRLQALLEEHILMNPGCDKPPPQ